MKSTVDTNVHPTLKTALIAVMGPTGAGKTSFINLLSKSTLEVGHGLESCTSRVQIAPPFLLDETLVTLVDTPGFDDTTRSETEILQEITAFMSTTYTEGTKLAGILYLHRISDNRVGGIARRNFTTIYKLCGEANLARLRIVTSIWAADTEPKSAEREAQERRETQLRSSAQFFKPALDKGAQMVRFEGSEEAAWDVVRTLLEAREVEPGALRVQEELVDEKKQLPQTDAGIELRSHLQSAVDKHEKEIEDVKVQFAQETAEVEEANRKQVESIEERAEAVANLQRELEEAVRALREKIRNAEEQLKQLFEQHAQLNQKIEELARKIREAEMAKERKVLVGLIFKSAEQKKKTDPETQAEGSSASRSEQSGREGNEREQRDADSEGGLQNQPTEQPKGKQKETIQQETRHGEQQKQPELEHVRTVCIFQ